MPLPFANMMAAGQAGAVAKMIATYTIPGTSQAFSFAGLSAGDLATIVTFSTASAGAPPPAGWNAISLPAWSGPGYSVAACWKVLTAADIAAGSVTITYGAWASNAPAGLICGYAGPSAVALGSTVETTAGASTMTLPGFTKVIGCRGLVFIPIDRDAASPFLPPGSLAIATRLAPTTLATIWRVGLYDMTSPAAYANGAGVTFTNFATSFSQYGVALQLS